MCPTSVPGNANAAQRFVFDAEQGALDGDIMVRTYLNKFSMAGPKVLDVRIHPNLPAGTLLMTAKTLPIRCPTSATSCRCAPARIITRSNGRRGPRRYETGVYADEVLQHYFPPSMAIIANIAAG